MNKIMKANQIIIHRESRVVDEGTMGFSDWVTHTEKMEDFIQRVTKKMRELDTIFVSYPNENIAIIQYWEK